MKTPMQRMGLEALYRRPCTNEPNPVIKIYLHLLRGWWGSCQGRPPALPTRRKGANLVAVRESSGEYPVK